MADYESILNVEEWISDHYLTTDEAKGESFAKSVEARIKEWKALESVASPWLRFTERRGEIQGLLADPRISAGVANRAIREALGYPELRPSEFHHLNEAFQVDAWVGDLCSVVLLEAGGGADDSSGSTDAAEDLSKLPVAGRVRQGEKHAEKPAFALVGDIFLSENPPEFIVILAGRWVVVAEREAWPLGRYLLIDLALAVERNEAKSGGELQRVVCALARENVERTPEGTAWWADVLDESKRHAIKVSGDLRDAVRESIEIIGNDVLVRRREQGLTDEIDGNELAKQALRYLYRILFLLFAEASPELEILPNGVPEYDDGYGLNRLRSLVLNPPATRRAEVGTHLYDSLQVLFELVDRGHNPETSNKDDDAAAPGLTFHNLRADLFKREATKYIDEVRLSNLALSKVLENLLLSKNSASERGFISYATLGVTELGQVYEGLMSYKGFVAQEDLYEVAPHGNPEKGSWVLPVSKADDVPGDSFVEDEVEADGGTKKVRRLHKRGSFVFRQSSRDRSRSASFYSPQVLTEFTVRQAIEVLQEEGRISSAKDILNLTVCEPAMGSGAFAVETVRQLAELYLDMRQAELGEQIPADERTRELQRVKAYIALHQVYGVDLNATAVELAEISLWLDTMAAGLEAPWFGLHLRQGNSLIGARRASYLADQVKDKSWLKNPPRREPVSALKAAIADGGQDPNMVGRIHHFLLPAEGWGAAADAKDMKKLAPAQQKALRDWRKSMLLKPSANQMKRLEKLSRRVDVLWQFALTRLEIAEEQSRRSISIFGRDEGSPSINTSREQIEADLFNNEGGAYRRLRLVMDAWSAMWFWPLTQVEVNDDGEATSLPSMDEWLDALTDILGDEAKKARIEAFRSFDDISDWDSLNTAEDFAITGANARPIATVLDKHPWLATVRDVAVAQAFFHWDLDFASVFAKGGFDLQVGNPPWVRPRTDLDALYAEVDPWFELAHKPTEKALTTRRERYAGDTRTTKIVFDGIGETVATAAFLGSVTTYPFLKGQQPDLYRAFMERAWSNNAKGVIAFIHPESHFTEVKAAPLRKGAYLRLRRHWQFINELKLFEVHNLVQYGVHVYGESREAPSFAHAASLYHPRTVTESLSHNGEGPLPGFKDDQGNWDLRPHRDRIQHVGLDALRTWHAILETDEVPVLNTRMVYTVNTEASDVLKKLARAPRISELGLEYSRGWDESNDREKGFFEVGWSHPTSWDAAIIQGPHLGVSTPMSKQPNPTLKSNKDWAEVDLEAISEDFIPATSYVPASGGNYDAAYTHHTIDGRSVSNRDLYRVAWRQMAAPTGYRTIYPALIPPGAAHVNGVISCASTERAVLASVGAFLSSLPIDFLARAIGSHLWRAIIETMPYCVNRLHSRLAKQYLRLNALTSAYAPIWEEAMGEEWTWDSPVRVAEARRAAQIDIDAIVAISLGITADELCAIYRTQFPVMRRYDEENRFDANGRIIPKDILKKDKKLRNGAELPESERRWVHPQSQVEYVFEYPFRRLDREADLRAAYEKYERILKD